MRQQDMKKNMIEIQGLKKSYKEVNVLRGVNLAVKQGEVFALLGSNGAGKTTIIKILSTILSADDGTSTIAEFDVSKEPKKVREVISLTGQFAAVDDILTGRENLLMIAKMRHLDDVKDKANQLLIRFGLVDAANRRVATYSGGMRRRLDIAMSLLGNPKVIFLDEPTTGLDPEGRNEVWKEIKLLSDNGTTVFLTTQYLEEAEQLADQIAILHDGVIIADGTLDQLKKLFPPAKVEYIEKQPTLEEIFLAIVSRSMR